jgi:hypothetical protein
VDEWRNKGIKEWRNEGSEKMLKLAGFLHSFIPPFLHRIGDDVTMPHGRG